MAAIDKVIVTDASALGSKYGAGFARVRAAIAQLIAADEKRGVRTLLVPIDNKPAMKRVRGAAVRPNSGPRHYKAAVDAVCAALNPDYLVILGATDIVPHQDLDNPLYAPDSDDDPKAFSDLPYACEAPYSKRIADFRAPTRVVGRLPDRVGDRDPSYLEKLLETASNYQTAPRSSFDKYLGITAEVWKASTALSLRSTFGGAAELQVVPPKQSRWPIAMLRSRMHFINCHGALADPHFYGQRGDNYPISHDAAYLASKVGPGTIVAAECCYGAELYDPALSEGQAGICSTYLGAGGYGFFGSSTIAYGPSAGNAQADVICQVFLQRVLLGASLGRAALEARQQYIAACGTLDPTDLKTIAQFNLLGDPAIHAVAIDLPALANTRAYRAALPDRADAARRSRSLRRRQLAKAGLGLEVTIGAAKRVTKKPPARVRAVLERAAKESGVRPEQWASFAVEDPGNKLLRGAKVVRPGPSAFELLIGTKRVIPAKSARSKAARARAAGQLPALRHVVVLTATVQDGKVVRLSRAYAKELHVAERSGRTKVGRRGLEE